MSVISADDLRYFLAVARRGKLVRAADDLGVDHTTIGRRITALEASLGQRLFDRTKRGWELTESGHQLLEPAESVAAAVLAAHNAVGAKGAPLQGRVRIASVEGFGVWCLGPALRRIRETHPGLTVEMLTSTAHLPLSVRDFDVAITMEEPTENDRVFKRHLSPYLMRLYATEEYLEGAGPLDTVEQLGDHTLLWWVDSLIDLKTLKDVHDVLGTVQLQGNSVGFLVQAVLGGAGVAPLPQFIAAREPRLVHVLPEIKFRSDYWLVVPRELARQARTKAVIELIDSVIEDRRDDICGDPPP